MKNDFYAKGLRFECTGSGKCCVSHNGYGYVYLTKFDRKRMAKELKLSTLEFTRKYCEKVDGIWKLKGDQDCIFLKNKRCSVYEGRPTQCRTWPFWPELMNAKTWTEEVATFCPGVNKGNVHEATEIEKVLQEQLRSEAAYGT